MEGTQSQPKPRVGAPVKPNISENFHTDRHSRSLKIQRAGALVPHHRVTLLLLGLLNAVLLITAIVLIILCAGANEDYLLTPDSVASTLLIERSYLRNHSKSLKAEQDAEASFAKEKEVNIQLRLQLNQETKISDTLWRQVDELHKEKDALITEKNDIEQNCGRCPSGWILLNSTCYYFSLPETDTYKNWPDSRADCIGGGGDLLVIDNLQEQILISEYISQTRSDFSMLRINAYWMGLQKNQSQGTWMWINNSTMVDSGYWRDQQPSINGPQSGDCAAFSNFIDMRKTWFSGNCQECLYNWVCEMVAKPLNV
ncbi:C-type lectin domain family 12 member B-like [Stigmatopora nigra]